MKDNSESTETITLFLAVIGLFYFRRKGSIFWTAIAISVLIYALGTHTPIFQIFYFAIPYLKKLRAPSMSMFVFSFSISLLAGMAIQTIREIDFTKYKPPRSLKSILIIVPGLLTIVGLLFYLAGEETLRLYAKLFYSSLISNPKLEGRYIDALNYLPNIVYGFFYSAIAVGLSSLVVWGFLRNKLLTGALLLLPILILLNGYRFNNRFVQLIDYNKEFGPSKTIQFLQQNVGYNRSIGLGMNERNIHTHTHRLSSTIGFHGNELKWYRDLLYHERFLDNYFAERFVNLMGVSHIINPVRSTLDPYSLGPIPFDTVATLEIYNIFENKNRFPRAYFVNQYEVIPNRQEIYPLVLNGDKNLREFAYLEEVPNLTINSSENIGHAEIVHYNHDSISIEISTTTNQLLILTDNWYPAWQAIVDGQERKIQRVYGSFRAVAIPAGSKKVDFVYRSTLYTVSKYLTLLGCLIVLSVFGFFFVKLKLNN